jgi:AraC family transcriptional regulator, arabinose operon regulatory protein
MTSMIDGPVVVQSGDLQFGPADRIHHRRVESRFALGCLSGRGAVTVDGRTIEVTPSSLHLLPWGHEIVYIPDPDQPFRVWGLHLVPRHRTGVPVVMRAAHHPSDPLAGSADRQDGPVGPRGLVMGWVSERPTLYAFALYVLELWRLDALGPDLAFGLGAMAAREWARPPSTRPFDDPTVPAELAQVLHWVSDHLDAPVTLQSMATVSGRSVSTLHRLFRQHLHRSPTDWVVEQRVALADALLSTTHLSVAEVGRACGFSDPLYFSRVFSRRRGASPTAWRARRQVR